jgi:LemA protein
VRDFEQETQTQIAQLRSLAGQAKSNTYNAGNTAELETAGAEMNSVLSRLLVIVEAYPDLKSNENFLALQDELAGTENRVKWERDRYNDEVRNYRVSTRRFPTSIVAGMAGFESDRWEQFTAEEGAEEAPDVVFT